MKARASHLVGRTIVAVDFREFADGRGGLASDPIVTLDDGRLVEIATIETEIGVYGHRLLVSNKPSRPRGDRHRRTSK